MPRFANCISSHGYFSAFIHNTEFYMLNYLPFSLFSGIFSLAARLLVSAVFIPPREQYSPGSLQHETGNLVIYFKGKKKKGM